MPWIPAPVTVDVLLTNAPGEIAALPIKATPAVGDVLLIEDSADADARKHVTIGSLPGGGGGGEIEAGIGTGSIADADTSVVVTHGLSRAPVAGEIQVQPRNVGHSVQRYAVHTETPTQFTVEVDPAPGAGNTFMFGWLWVAVGEVDYGAVVMADGPWAYWRFEETSFGGAYVNEVMSDGPWAYWRFEEDGL